MTVTAHGRMERQATRYQRVDRSGAQIHFVHAVPTDRLDRTYDRTEEISWIADRMQRWLHREAGAAHGELLERAGRPQAGRHLHPGNVPA